MLLELVSALGSSGLFIIVSNWLGSRKIAKMKKEERETREGRESLIKDSLQLGNLQKATDLYEQEIEFLREVRQDLIEEVRHVKADAAAEIEHAKSQVEVLKTQLTDALMLINEQTHRIQDLEELLPPKTVKSPRALLE